MTRLSNSLVSAMYLLCKLIAYFPDQVTYILLDLCIDMSYRGHIFPLGDSVDIQFEVAGDYMPEIRFFKGKREIKPNNKVSFNIDAASKKGEISILKSKFSDEGKYCVQLVSQNNTVVDDANFNVFVKGQ